MKKTITRSDLAKSISKKFGLSKKDSMHFVKSVFNEICDSAVRGETIKISSFATFNVKEKGPRIGRNLQTNQEVIINPRRVMVFRASSILKKRIIDDMRNSDCNKDDVTYQ
ncbi:integration host factor subunit alpha [Candidatus Liberibacter africanus]|uniref:Integration host factor subunit alpha n=1 Tax=Candidatus Liberibacter africanus PTSAPSY TaxID=1277257 RepID=A0A0G3I3H9_LIBAF|nr:integration host factor subunit alpha [Candidatus Liberibacter africanus]AKK20399.1 integration host factor subunit alpha [Candidatus Liberibacter africanus PTSAPSY]QTP64130.1 integration host factor subunit alpha [Candidatus Liberibacter africanus]